MSAGDPAYGFGAGGHAKATRRADGSLVLTVERHGDDRGHAAGELGVQVSASEAAGFARGVLRLVGAVFDPEDT